ncbi:ankyrin repeat domain-containing protein [Microbacterium hydrocarbonoxydans]|uniref:ankyrin repeat domain-containing protein n=1 Tax=Microbacterium hydrocarbonoxydans TaxID=273678 RepID=UPI001FBC0E3C|nr:ankyrin repeat domain-containing protein [Microbacterium hydrocarbonoxydans]
MRRPFALLLAGVVASVVLTACTSAPMTADPTGEPTGKPSAAEIAQAEKDEALRDAAWQNDLAAAAALVAEGADVDAKDQTQQSAYLIATSEGYLDLLRLTLANGADVDDKDSWNGTGLIRAAERGHGYVVGRLLQAGIDRDHVNRIGYQAIHEAVIFGEDTAPYALTVRALIAGGVEFDRPSGSEGLTPIEMAAQQGLPGLESILSRAAAASAPADPSAALLEAARTGDADAAALAIRAGADLEVHDPEFQRTPLMEAVLADHVAVAQLLVAMGADPDAPDHRRDTPWVMTGVTGSVAMLEALLPGQPDLGIPNRRGGTPAHPAAERGHVEYIRRIVTVEVLDTAAVATRVDLNRVNLNGWTALLEAVVFGDGGADHQEIVRILLDAGADPSIRDAQGCTALDNAQRLGFTEIARILGG